MPVARKSKDERRSPKSRTPAPEPLAEGEYHRIPLSRLVASSLNPRKTFPPESIAELAATIKAQGLQHALIARERPDGDFEVYVGGRRLRALELLARERWISPHYDVAVDVRAASDAEVREAALTENLQREPMNALEEGAAFEELLRHAVRGDGATERLAARIGKTPRFIQQRRALVRNLSARAKDLLLAGELLIDQARSLASLPLKVQDSILDDIDLYTPAEEIRQWVGSDLPLFGDALFDIAPWASQVLDVLADGEDLADQPFPDPEVFRAEQKVALATTLADLHQRFPWVDSLSVHLHQGKAQLPSAYGRQKARLKEGATRGALVLQDHQGFRVAIVEGVYRLLDLEGAAPAPEPGVTASPGSSLPSPQPVEPKAPLTHAQITAAWITRVQTLQQALAARPTVALALVCASLLTAHHYGSGLLALRPETFRPSRDDRSRLLALLEELQLAKLEAFLPLFERISALTQEQQLALLATLAAETLHGGWFEGSQVRELGDHAADLALAKALGVAQASPPALEYVQMYQKARLVALAPQLGLDPAQAEKSKVADLHATLHAAMTEKGYVPPELRFGNRAEIFKEFKKAS